MLWWLISWRIWWKKKFISMLQRHHMYRLPGRGKNFDPALFWQYSHSYLLYRCTLTILMSTLLGIQSFWQWLVTFTKSFTSLVSRLVGFFMRRLQTTSVKSHARKKRRVGYFLSLSIDQIKMHQSRNWILTCNWRRVVGAVVRHRKKCTQPCTVKKKLSTNLTFSVFTLKRVSDMTNIYCQK